METRQSLSPRLESILTPFAPLRAVLTWIWTRVSDHRISTAFPFITKLLPEFFRMQEVLDNDVRSSCASSPSFSSLTLLSFSIHRSFEGSPLAFLSPEVCSPPYSWSLPSHPTARGRKERREKTRAARPAEGLGRK